MATGRTGRTGEKCTSGGKYHCQTHPSNVIPIAKGDTFPPCNYAGQHHSTTWVQDEEY